MENYVKVHRKEYHQYDLKQDGKCCNSDGCLFDSGAVSYYLGNLATGLLKNSAANFMHFKLMSILQHDGWWGCWLMGLMLMLLVIVWNECWWIFFIFFFFVLLREGRNKSSLCCFSFLANIVYRSVSNQQIQFVLWVSWFYCSCCCCYVLSDCIFIILRKTMSAVSVKPELSGFFNFFFFLSA